MSWVSMATSEENYKRKLSMPINGIAKYASEMGGVVLRNCDDGSKKRDKVLCEILLLIM